MAEKSRLAAFLTRDHRQLAELYRQEGKKDKALEMYTRAGEWRLAGRLALELRQLQTATEHFLTGALGKASDAYAEASPVQAAQLLMTTGHIEEALLLFEAGGAPAQAAVAALKLKDLPRAALLFERARDLDQAALYYERAERFNDALRVLEQIGKQNVQGGRWRASGQDPARRDFDLRRAEILLRLGRAPEAAALFKAWGLSVRLAQLLEKAGDFVGAVDACLEGGHVQEALRLAARARGLPPRTLARLHMANGQPREAARLLAGMGEAREAAEAFEQAGELVAAAHEWQKAREPERAAQALMQGRRYAEAARLFEQLGQVAKAAECYEKAGDKGAAATAFLKLGRFLEASTQLLGAGDRDAAAKALQQVPAGGHDFERATLLLVPLLLEDGLPGAALQRLRMLAPASAGGVEANIERLYWEGRAQQDLGRLEEAQSAYQKLVALRRDHRDASARMRDVHAQLAATRLVAVPAPAVAPTLREPVAAGRLPSTSSIQTGAVLAGRYEIRGELGRGGMGAVYRAFDRELGDQVALKVVLRDPETGVRDEERLLRELQICRRITHPNVLRVYDLGRMEDGIFITMELLEGVGLDTLIGNGKQLSFERVRSILTEVLAGLGEAHELGVVHRDLKPSNLLLTPRHLKILDFGIARRTEADDPRLTRTGFAVGTPLYMSPEQIRGEALDGRSDLYAAGILAFTLVAGREPFLGPGPGLIVLDHLHTPPPKLEGLRPGTPPPWQAFVETLLAKQAADRYATAAQAATVLGGLPVG